MKTGLFDCSTEQPTFMSLTKLGDGFIKGLCHHGNTFFESIERDGERGANLHRLAPGTNGREEQQALLIAEFDDAMSQIMIGLFGATFYGLQTCDESNSGDVADVLGMFGLDGFAGG